MAHSARKNTRFRFTIRIKLLLMSIVILSIPYIGYEYMRELERHLRTSLENSLIDAARAVAGPMHNSYQLFPYIVTKPDHTLFIHSLNNPIHVDGYADDWVNYLDWADLYYVASGQHAGGVDDSLSVKSILGQYNQYLYVLLQVNDDTIVYHEPVVEEAIGSDYVELVIGDEYTIKQRYFFSPSAPGRFNPFQIEKIVDEWEEKEYTRYVTNITAEWQETGEGYNLEISIPLHLLDKHMGFVIGDVDDKTSRRTHKIIGTAGPDTGNHPGLLLKPSAKIEQIIRRIDTTEGRRIWVLNNRGQVLASTGTLRRNLSSHPLNIFYTIILPPVSERFRDDLAGASSLHGQEVQEALEGKTGSRWRQSPDKKAVIVSAATPVWITDEVRGAIVVEETTNNIQMLRRHALVSLINRTLIVFFLITFLLIIFATRLSIRLRRLSNEASSAIDDYGRVIGSMSVSNASDEIGDLSRNYSAMLERLRQYNLYLETMSGKLSHELRTPMAIVQSSLDNLQAKIGKGDEKYLQRACDGIRRLELIITRLSEAARLEQALQSSEMVETDLCELLTNSVESYRLAYKQTDFILDVPSRPVMKNISPELFVQMLDKIIGNAVDFSAAGSKPVEISVSAGDPARIDVINYGSSLPEIFEGQLFNSMVSMRDKKKNEEPHLGLGLYIARVIAEFHHAVIKAENLDQDTGVRFSIVF